MCDPIYFETSAPERLYSADIIYENTLSITIYIKDYTITYKYLVIKEVLVMLSVNYWHISSSLPH